MGCWRIVLRRCLLRLCVLTSVFKCVHTTICTDRAGADNFNHVMKMCQDSSVTSRTRVLIDTYDTGAPDVHSCRCTATYSSGVSTDVTVTAYPNTAPPDASCMSTLKVTSTKTSNTFSEYSCIAISPYDVGNFETSNDIITLTLSRSNGNSPWISGHCIYISTGNYHTQNPTTFTVRCYTAEKSQTMTTTTTPTTTPPLSLPPTTTTTPPSLPPTTTTTTTPISTVKPSTLSPTSSADTTKVETSTAVTDTIISPREELGFEIIVGAAAGGVVLIIIIIIIIIVFVRKRKSSDKQPYDPSPDSKHRTNGDISDDMQPYAMATSNMTYSGEDKEIITPNSLYMSAGPRRPDTSHIITGTGDVYAQVKKTTKRDEDGNLDQNIFEQADEETAQGAVYAVVNKPKKNANEEKEDSNEITDKRPYRYTNEDGLVYAQVHVDVQDRSSRPRSRRPPPVKPKPKTGTNRVI